MLAPTVWGAVYAAVRSSIDFHCFMTVLRLLWHCFGTVLRLIWGYFDAQCVRTGRPPGYALMAAGLVGAVLPAVLHRTVSAKDWAPAAAPKAAEK